MAECQLVENGGSDEGPGGLFNERAFFDLHSRGEARYFEWRRKSQVMARVHFTCMETGLWRSPARGTFAGYGLRPELSLDGVFAFHDAVMARLARAGADRIEVLPAPSAHDPQAFAHQVYMLQSRGFRVSRCDLNQSLDVSSLSLDRRMSYGELKRLRKCRLEGLLGERLPLSELDAVYGALSETRSRKGHAMSMSQPQLQDMTHRFPDAVRLFGIRDGDTLAAAAFCLRLDPRVLYVFMWGDRAGYERFSPVVALADAIYAYCQGSGIAILDVGTSTEGSIPNFGLLRFKRGLGFSESLKLRMHLDRQPDH